MIILDYETLVKCRKYGLKTIKEINDFTEKYGINNNDELEKVLKGELSVSTINVVDEKVFNETFEKLKREERDK